MVRFGVQICQGRAKLTYEQTKKLWRKCEALGFDSVYLYDHFTPEPCLEAWTLISSLANVCSKIKFGVLVLCNSYRHPAVLARMAATLDIISNGRLEFGIGAGGWEQEYTAYGIPFDKPSVRVNLLDESLQIIKMIWTQDKPSFNGKYYTIKEAMTEPKPIQKPHPLIIVGSVKAGKLMCRVAAKYANSFNFFAKSTTDCIFKLDTLRNQCLKIGRRFEDIEKSLTIETQIIGFPGDYVKTLDQYIQLGIGGFVLILRSMEQINELKLFASEVIPKLH